MNQVSIRADEATVDDVLAVRTSNQAAFSLYTRNGFHKQDERDDMIAMQRLAGQHRG